MKEKEMVCHPEHYNKKGIECFDVIKAFYGLPAFEHFCLGNALKYIMRCTGKGAFIEDLKKAKFYIEEILEQCGDKTDEEIIAELTTCAKITKEQIEKIKNY